MAPGTDLQWIVDAYVLVFAGLLLPAMPTTLSIAINAHPADERPKAIALWAGFSAVGGIVAPISSGLLLEHFEFHKRIPDYQVARGTEPAVTWPAGHIRPPVPPARLPPAPAPSVAPTVRGRPCRGHVGGAGGSITTRLMDTVCGR